MLSIRNISAGYGDKLVLHNIAAEVKTGEFLGLIGPNGCGKTTLLRVASGVFPPKAGQVLLNGTDVQAIRRPELAKTMACLSQNLALDFSFTVREVTWMGRAPHMSRIGGGTARDREVVEWAMALADVSHLADRPITETSGGERQRAFIAMCLAQEPRVLLLDEPTNHLDIGHQLSVLNLVRRLNAESGLTVLAVFHDLNLASEYCDRLVLLNEGRVRVAGAPHEVLTEEIIATTYGARILTCQHPLTGRPHVMACADLPPCRPGQEAPAE